ncbi:MAG TPA: ABC transporter permease [Blastocatellia bacterium]|jgi:predicted permease
MTNFWQDLRYSARMLLKNPAFTLVAVITLSLGIGVNTALFAGFNLLLRPNPIKDPDTVVRIERQSEDAGRIFSYPDYVYYRDHAQTLSDFLPTIEEKFLLSEQASGVEPLEIRGIFTSENYLSALGGNMLIGRFFTQEENRVEGRDAVIVLSHYFWRQRFAGDLNVIGRTLLLNGKSFTVIGVASPDFVGLQIEAPDVWLPLMMRADKSTLLFAGPKSEGRDWFGDQEFPWLSLHARLKTGKTPAEAQAELALLQNRAPRAAEAPRPIKFISVAPTSSVGGAGKTESFWTTMAVALGASGLVLLITCSNIANMLLARGARRALEIGVRLAVGASRWRVIRLLLTESFLLAVAGGATGVLFARWSVELLFPWVFARTSGRIFAKTALSLSPDWRVMVFAMSLSLLSGVAFGLVPALHATRQDLIPVINGGQAPFGGRIARSLLRNGLVVAQVALCFVLLIPAGLLLRALTKALTTDRGYVANKLLVVEYRRKSIEKGAPDARLFRQQLMSRLAALPGVQSVCPQSDSVGQVRVILLDKQGRKAPDKQFDQVPFQWVTANYLDTIGTPLILGRGFTAEEVDFKTPVIIVSQSTARNLWPGENPLDKTMHVEQRMSDLSVCDIMPRAKVIGVARDNQIYRSGHIPPLFIYAPQPPFIDEYRQLLVRAASDAASVKESARKEAFALEPGLILTVGTMEAVFGEDSIINNARVASELAVALGGLALLLAALGLYGVMAHSVAHRTREIGVRMALGAQASHVQMLIIAQGMKLILIGVLIGIPISMAASQAVKRMLFGLSTRDPATYGAVALLLGIAGLIACWIPARRAAKAPPVVALRFE